MFFYNLMVYIILIYAQKISFQSNELIEKIFPFTANAYWFMTAYIMLLLLLPIFQKTINNLDLKQLKYLIIILAVFCTLFPLFKNLIAGDFMGLGDITCSYLVGVYVKKANVRVKQWMIAIPLLLSYILLFLGHRVFASYGLLPLISAGLIFAFFEAKTLSFHSVFINKSAATVLSVYLITEQKQFIKPLWSIFHFEDINVFLANFLGLGIAIAFIVLGVFIDSLRKQLFSVIKVNQLINYVQSILTRML